MFPGSGSGLVDAPWGFQRLSGGNWAGEIISGASWASLLTPPSLANLTESPSPTGICYQAEPEEIDGESVPEGPPFANIGWKEAGLIHC